MTKRRTPWRQTTQVCLRVHFETHPDVHTFIHHAETGDICALLRDLLREHIQRTGHPAGNPAIQKETAMAGMSHLIDQTISAARPDSVGTPAPSKPNSTSPQVPTAQAAAQPPAPLAAAAPPVVPPPAVQRATVAITAAVLEPASREESPAGQSQVAPSEAISEAGPPAKKPGIVGRFNDD